MVAPLVIASKMIFCRSSGSGEFGESIESILHREISRPGVAGLADRSWILLIYREKLSFRWLSSGKRMGERWRRIRSVARRGWGWPGAGVRLTAAGSGGLAARPGKWRCVP